MMKNVRFTPWIGARYTQGISGKRVAVLGESHYCASPNEAIPQITINVISDLLDPHSEHEPYKNTYTKFERALAGKPLTAEEKIQLWNSILFYNYVQQPISGPRIAPTGEQFASSAPAFFEVLEQYRPDLLIAWGYRLYNNLPSNGKQLPSIVASDGKEIERWQYTLSDGKQVAVLSLMHPSAPGFVPAYWHEVIKQALDKP